MMADKGKSKAQEQPTNGGTPPENPAEDTAPEQEQEPNVTLAAELDWMRPLFGRPVTVQTVDPIWRICSQMALLVQVLDENGKPKIGKDGNPEIQTLGIPELLRDKKGEPEALDVFPNAEIQPSRSGTHVVIMVAVDMGKELGFARAQYVVPPQQIRSIAQVIPSEPQVQKEIDKHQAHQIVVPGAPGNQPGKIIT
jgi:hypothetical protein